MSQGVNVGINGKFLFATRFYKSPLIAIEHEDCVESDIREDLYTLMIDEYNSLHFSLTSDNKLLVTEMRMKGNKYLFTGNYSLYDLHAKGDINEDGAIGFNSISLYDKYGFANRKLHYAVVFDETIAYSDYSYEVVTIQANSFKDSYVVYHF